MTHTPRNIQNTGHQYLIFFLEHQHASSEDAIVYLFTSSLKQELSTLTTKCLPSFLSLLHYLSRLPPLPGPWNVRLACSNGVGGDSWAFSGKKCLKSSNYDTNFERFFPLHPWHHTLVPYLNTSGGRLSPPRGNHIYTISRPPEPIKMHPSIACTFMWYHFSGVLHQ